MAEATPEDKKTCGNCHHCIDIYWTEKIVCLAFLEVRPVVESGRCAEFTPRKNRPQAKTVSGI